MRAFFEALREIGEVAADGWHRCGRCGRYIPRLLFEAHVRGEFGEKSCVGPSLPYPGVYNGSC